MDGRYNTQTYPFQKEYAENALLQKGFNQQIIVDLVQFILRKISWAKTKPIKILDLCCGDGSCTNELLLELEKQGIKVDKIIGLDIAPEQIARAQSFSAKDSRLEFNIQNIEQLSYINEFDVVISLFGLHWVEDIAKVSKLISLALKPDGNLVFFVPLEKNDFFTLRQKMMSKPDWVELFNNFSIHPFVDNPNEYLQSFSKYFNPENGSGIAGDQPVYFSNERFIRFLSSWMQEVRYLKQKGIDSDSYLQDLVSTIQPSKDPTADVSTHTISNTNHIRFLEKFFWYHADKKVPVQVEPTLNCKI